MTGGVTIANVGMTDGCVIAHAGMTDGCHRSHDKPIILTFL